MEPRSRGPHGASKAPYRPAGAEAHCLKCGRPTVAPKPVKPKQLEAEDWSDDNEPQPETRWGAEFSDCDWAHGVAVARWIASEIPYSALTQPERQALSRWRRGAQASVYTLDKLLLNHGYCLASLPKVCWISQQASEESDYPLEAIAETLMEIGAEDAVTI